MPHDILDEQRKRWNGPAGHAWVDAQEVLDRLLKPLEDRLADLAAALHPDRLLDVGCGTGSTTVAIARRLGAPSECVGVDISEPMLAAARARAAREGVPAAFICADAQTYGFEPARVDLIVSRFGVMFFQDSVAAFANLRRAARDGGQLRLIVWRGPADNPFMTVAASAAASVLALPEASGFDLTAYLVPIVAILVAAVAAGFGVRSWRRSGGRSDGGGKTPPTRPSGEDAERLEADLSRYDL